jgi:hypothetical protein
MVWHAFQEQTIGGELSLQCLPRISSDRLLMPRFPHIPLKLKKHQGFYYRDINNICHIFHLFVMSVAKMRDFLIISFMSNTQIMQKKNYITVKTFINHFLIHFRIIEQFSLCFCKDI